MGNSYVEISYVKRFQFHMCKCHVEISYVKRFQFHMCKFHVWISYVKRFQFYMWNFICENFTYEIFVRYVCVCVCVCVCVYVYVCVCMWYLKDEIHKMHEYSAHIPVRLTVLKEKKAQVFGALYCAWLFHALHCGSI